MAKYEQKVGLGIDFAQFDRDLRSIADKIEAAGKGASARAGALAGDLAVGKLDTGDTAAAVAMVGSRLSAGIADGVRQASGLMLGFAAHVDKMLDRLAGAAITIFRRIDSAMKFPAFDAFFKTAQLKLSNFSAIWRKPLSDLDVAMSGGFGSTVQRIAKIAKNLVDQLAATIAGALKDAVAGLATEFARVATGIQRSEASAVDLLKTTEKVSATASKYPRFGPIGRPGTSSRPFPGVGRRIGAGTDFMAAAPEPERRQFKFPAAEAGRAATAALRGTGIAAMVLTSLLGKVGAALISVPLRAYVPFARLRNFMGDIGDVGKKSFRQLYEQNGLLVGTILAATKAVTGLVGAVVRVGTLGVFGKATKDAEGFSRATATAKTSVGQLTGSVKALGGAFLAAFGVVGIAVKTIQFFRDGIMGASDLNETVSKSKVVFGESFGAIEAQANRISRAFGISRREQIDLASGFGAMAQGAGYAEDASAALANQLTKMAVDMSSSENMPLEEAGTKIRAALAGEAEPLQRFGVNVRDATVKSYALATGISKSAKTMTDQQKIAARAGLIMRGLSYAQGDLERTSDSAANQFRKAGGGIQEFGTRLGELMLPAVRLGTEAFNTLLGALLDVFEATAPTIQSWMGYVVGAMEKVGMVARNLGAVWQIAQLRVGEFVINTIEWIKTIPANFGPITEWLGQNWWNLLVDLANGTKTVFMNLIENATSFAQAIWSALQGEPWEFAWTPLLDGFQAVTEALPELIKPALISVDDEVNRIWAGIAKKEAERAAAVAGANVAGPKKPGAITGEAEAKGAEYRLASAVEVGSKEAYSVIARSLAPGANSDPAKQTTKAVNEGNKVLRDIRDAVKGGAAPALQLR